MRQDEFEMGDLYVYLEKIFFERYSILNIFIYIFCKFFFSSGNRQQNEMDSQEVHDENRNQEIVVHQEEDELHQQEVVNLDEPDEDKSKENVEADEHEQRTLLL